MMADYLPLEQFKAIYIVDLCHSLCEQVSNSCSSTDSVVYRSFPPNCLFPTNSFGDPWHRCL